MTEASGDVAAVGREQDERASAWAPARRGLVPAAGRALLLASVPLAVVWVPVASLPGLGNVAAADVVLLGLWAAALLELALRGAREVEPEPFVVLACASAVGLLAGLGAEIAGHEGSFVLEALLLMKRFGFAAILPLAAALFRSRGVARATRVLTVLCMAAMVLFTLRPELQAHLPRPTTFDPTAMDDRPTGLLTNPNDLAYASVALAVLHAAFLPRRAPLLERAVLAATLAGAAICVVSSGSRSGLIGSAGALAFLTLASGVRWRSKVVLLAVSGVVIAAGLSSSPLFHERIERFYRQRLGDENVSSRLEAQWIAVQASAAHPLGVGYQNFLSATANLRKSYAFTTSDSVYVDTLLGAGVPGLMALLALLAATWRHASRRRDDARRIRQAGLVAFLLFGTAAVVPISVFLAPLFFWIPAAAALARARS
jgi:O-antigen ligase